ncbi:MAG: flagellar motor protein [Acidobacteriaceae bacterium]|nr:flagellar motor protein [Acidobacteriaceae bacterium]
MLRLTKLSFYFQRLDFTTFVGLTVAVLGIVGGLLLEGGKLSDVAQLTAALIVLGGTAGAVMITTPMHLLTSSVKKLPTIFLHPAYSADSLIQQIQRYAIKARRSGLVSLDAEINSIEDGFLRKALTLVVDGTDPKEVRRIMEVEIILTEQRGEAEARVFDCAGGYAPTIGIIGAVLGLIQVMKHLEDLQVVGQGIAIAFVATVYGVSFANIFFLPAANKLRARLQLAIQMKELALEGVVALAEGLNPRLIGSKLEPFKGAVGESPTKEKRERRAAARTAA